MSLMQTLRTKLTESRKAGRPVELSVIQVVLGEATMAEARSGQAPSDEEVEKIVRKTMLGNAETMGLMEKRGLVNDAHARLGAENAFLQTLLPATLGVDEVVAALAEAADAVKAAKSDGQATGVAMKHLKGKGLKVLGDDVSAAVRRLRGA
ncbi:MAG: GatB/YqeY domain-containing protein [Gemmataceae bacterium]